MKTKKTMKTMKKFHPKNLAQAVSLGLVMACGQQAMANDNAGYQQIGDLEIYKAAEGGSVTITMMLDISGSMGSVDSACTNPVAATSITSAGTQTYYLKDETGKNIDEITRANGEKVNTSSGVKLVNYGFRTPSGNWGYCAEPTTRMEKLKQAMLELISTEGLLGDNIRLGVGTFPATHNWSTGQIAVPAKPLTREQRWELMRYISTLSPIGSTPSAQAYVEAGAYMLGNTTTTLGAAQKRVLTVGSMEYVNFRGTNSYRLLSCGGAGDWFVPATRPDGTRTGTYWSIANTPTTVRHANGGSLQWYSCNDVIAGIFPAFDYDASTRSTPWVVPPNHMARLDFNLLSDFDVMWTPGSNAVSMTNTTKNNIPSQDNIPRNSSYWGTSTYYFGKTLEYRVPTIGNSGFPLSATSTKKADGATYESPITPKAAGEKHCDGYGIYFLTDGEPNGGTVDARNSATLSLGKGTGRYAGSSADFPRGADANGYWDMIGAYAKDLREKNNNLNVEIRTATVGFGGVFTPVGGTPTTTKMIDGKPVQVANCDGLGTIDAQNLCRWGERGYGYGEGGFLATSDPSSVSQSVIDFAGSLNQTIPSSPSGTIAVPSDPLSDNNIQPYAYLPMLEAQVDKAVATWPGNLKKYDTVNGTLQGANGERLYVKSPATATTSNKDFPYAINARATDRWQRASSPNNSQIDVGGAYERLKALAPAQRTLYVESVLGGKRQLVKVGVTAARALVGFDQLGSEYTVIDKAYILNYLGYNVPVDAASYTDRTKSANQQLEEKLASATTYGSPTLGGVMHSVPALVSYKGQFTLDTGLVNSDATTREDYLLYGSMDGALHMVDDDTGVEEFGFIPRAIFADEDQRKALIVNNDTGIRGEPVFGVDGPWMTKSEYSYDYSGLSKNPVQPVEINAEKIYAYGGLRMGGVGFYGLDVTSKSNPKLLFSIDNTTSKFERLGQTWSKPLIARIKTGPNREDVKDVLIFGGGYDMCYENPRFSLNSTDIGNTDASCDNKAVAQGNAVYMIDAKDGSLVASWSTKEHADMKHSIVSEITGLDRNNNGFIDHLYFGDLGGQVFRIDLNEGTDSESAIKRRVVKVFDANAENANKGKRIQVIDGRTIESDVSVPFRFYGKPLVSFYNVPNESVRLAVVNISTGDRSNPLSRLRGDKSYDRVYGIFDRDLADSKLSIAGSAASSVQLSTENLTDKDLIRLDGKETENGTDASRKQTLTDVKGSKGWYYDLNRFDGRYGVPHVKSVGSATVMASTYIMSAYSPDYKFSSRNSCEAGIEGGTERQMYCLPWGICVNDDGVLIDGSSNGTLGFIKVGPGLQEMATGTLTSTAGRSTRYSTILGAQTIQEMIDSKGNRGSANEPNPALKDSKGNPYPTNGGGGPNPPPIIGESRVFEPTYWYNALQDEGQ